MVTFAISCYAIVAIATNVLSKNNPIFDYAVFVSQINSHWQSARHWLSAQGVTLLDSFKSTESKKAKMTLNRKK